MKKALAFIFSLCLLVGSLCITARGAEVSQDDLRQQVMEEAKWSYKRSQRTAGRRSFLGYCGLMVSHQLYNLEINTERIVKDGNRQYDYYKDLNVTGGGHYITAYSGKDYTLLQALNAVSRHGTKNVRNILVGFQWTRTQAGRKYGHALLINGIIDGTVYFMESYATSLNKYYKEGEVISCSIEFFAEHYSGWAKFEGLIHFGEGQYAESCKETGTDLILQTRFESVVRSQPAVVGQNDCVQVRTLAAGERLHASAIVEDKDGYRYYQVEEGFVAATAVACVRINQEDLSISNLQIANRIAPGKDTDIKGIVFAKNGQISALEITVSDSEGNVALQQRKEVSGYRCDLSSLNGELSFDTLQEGTYLVEIYADSESPMVDGRRLVKTNQHVRLGGQLLQVGGTGASAKVYPMGQGKSNYADGWVWDGTFWYYRVDGEALTGWQKICGVEYYFDSHGAALTGWQEVDGTMYWFSETGALCKNKKADA